MASTMTPAPDRHPFLHKVDNTKIPKCDINNFIMDYLVTEGYPLAAEKFAREAKIQPTYDHQVKTQYIDERVQIREAIHRGDLQTAIELINELNPELLDKDGALHFSLLRLQLIELIRKIPTCPDHSATREALEFATQSLAPRTSTNDQWRNEFEKAMTLLLFKPDDWTKQQQFQASAAASAATSSNNTRAFNGSTNPSATTPTQPPFGALSELIDPNLRRKVAKDVNEAILRSHNRTPEAKLYQLVRARAWAEKLAREKKMDLPATMDLGLDGNETNAGVAGDDVTANNNARNGHANGGAGNNNGDTVMTGAEGNEGVGSSS